jgi:DNA-binding PadR family transcriptional regulator
MNDSSNPPAILDDVQKRNFVHEQDYEYSRDTYYDLIEKGRESLELMIEVARESEHPRAFEVLSGMIKGIADVNDKLMDLNKKQKELTKEDKPPESSTTNNLFVGSTTDLQRMLLGDEKTIDQSDDDEDNIT